MQPSTPPNVPAPFSCQFTPNLPELLYRLRCTIVLSTYQAGKVVFLSADNENNIKQLPRSFRKAMGIAVDADLMAIATQDEVILLKNAPSLATFYPNSPNTYDALFMPRATFYTGQVDIHDLHFGNQQKLWAVNTSFSCLCTIDAAFSFIPVWQPPFVSALASEDRCHLNGIAMQDGEPLFVSALGTQDTPQGWRNNITQGGVVLHIPSNQIVAQGLGMPHSPRLYDGKLYLLLSAEERLVCIEPETGRCDTVVKINGFVRGMAKYGDYLFVATSKLRQNSSTFRKLPFSQRATTAGITVVHLPTAAIVGKLTYLASVDEIYDVQILPNTIRPNILNTIAPTFRAALHLPQTTFWASPEQLKALEKQ